MTGMGRKFILSAVLALSAALGSTAGAQQEPVSALKGHNSNAPVDVAADRIEVQDRAIKYMQSNGVEGTAWGGGGASSCPQAASASAQASDAILRIAGPFIESYARAA